MYFKIHRNGIAFFQPIVEDKTAAYWSYGIVLKPHRGVRHLATKFKKKKKKKSKVTSIKSTTTNVKKKWKIIFKLSCHY